MSPATDLIRPIIFISYSHDSDAHRETVLSLSELLRKNGFETRLDQYVNGTPPEMWPRWMLDRLDEASHVLVICTETYYRRFRGHEIPGKGKGVDWEGALITQEIYDTRSQTVKFTPVLLPNGDPKFIPEPLRGHTRYSLTSEANYQALHDFLLGAAGAEPGDIGELKPKTRRTGRPLSFGDAPRSHSTKPNNMPLATLGSLFKGREEFLDTVRNKLQRGGHVSAIVGAQAVHGLGGLGKTRAAVEYALRHADEYSALLFVAADRPETLEKSLADLCGPLVLNLPEKDVKEQSVRYAAVVTWLHEHPGWFLILDNVDDKQAAKAVEDLLPHLRDGHVLITSRFREWSGGVKRLDLEILTPEASIDFLQERTEGSRRLEPDDEEAVTELVRELDGLPLALEQAAAFLVVMQESFAGYLRRWKAHEEKVRTWHDATQMNYPRSIAVTWDTSFEQLTFSSRALLNMLSWYAPDPIPVAVWQTERAERAIADGAQRLSPSTESLDAEDARAGLSRYGLIQWKPDRSAFSVHRLVQEVTRERLTPAEETASLQDGLEVLNLYLSADPPPQDVRSWPHWNPVRVHVATIVEHADKHGIAEPTSRLMNQLGLLLKVKGLWDEAEKLYRRALAIVEQSYGAQHPKVSNLLNNLAQLLQDTNRLAEAEPLMRLALVLDEQSYGSEHPNVAIVLNNLAQLLTATNRLAEAEPLLRRALVIMVTSLGANHPSTKTVEANYQTLLEAEVDEKVRIMG